MKHLVFVLIVFILVLDFGCGNRSSNSNNQLSPTPTPTEEEKKAITAQVELEKQKAVTDYVTINHKGWSLNGISNGKTTDPLEENLDDAKSSKCDVDVPCYLHLSQKDQNKVVAIVLRQFKKDDGKIYWFVYDANPIDLAKVRIKELRQKTLKNLTIDECQGVFEDYDPGDYDPGDYNPRGY